MEKLNEWILCRERAENKSTGYKLLAKKISYHLIPEDYES